MVTFFSVAGRQGMKDSSQRADGLKRTPVLKIAEQVPDGQHADNSAVFSDAEATCSPHQLHRILEKWFMPVNIGHHCLDGLSLPCYTGRLGEPPRGEDTP